MNTLEAIRPTDGVPRLTSLERVSPSPDPAVPDTLPLPYFAGTPSYDWSASSRIRSSPYSAVKAIPIVLVQFVMLWLVFFPW